MSCYPKVIYFPSPMNLHAKLSSLSFVACCVSACQNDCDIHDSPVWKIVYSKQGVFNGDKQGINLGLCTDGVSPFSHHKVTYSMWPIMITLLNLPRKMRCLFQNILLLGIFLLITQTNHITSAHIWS